MFDDLLRLWFDLSCVLFSCLRTVMVLC